MRVLVEFGPSEDPAQRGPELARATGMKLLGIAPSLNAAAYDNGTDDANGSRAAATLKTLWADWVTPGVIAHYNYGATLAFPGDLGPISAATPVSGGAPAAVAAVSAALTDTAAGVPVWLYVLGGLLAIAAAAFLAFRPHHG